MPNFITNLLQQLPEQMVALTTLDTVLQVVLFLLIFPLSRLVRRYIRPTLERFHEWAAQLTWLNDLGWLDDIFTVTQSILYPLIAWLLGYMAVTGLLGGGRDVTVLAWAVPFLAIWLLYRLLGALLHRRLAPDKAMQWLQRFVRPLIWIAALLHAIGLLDNVLSTGIEFGDNQITLRATGIGLLVLYVFLLLAKNSRQLLSDTFLPQIGVEASLTQILATFVGYAIIIFGVVTALNVIGLPLTTLTVIAGGLSVGIGFGMQEVISNFISGFILLFERSIGPGDVVQVEGTIGVVENIGIRAMRIKNLDNVELIVPNNDLLTNTVTNFTRGDRLVQARVCVGVSYSSDPRQVEQTLIEAASHKNVLPDPPPHVHFTDFGDNSLEFELLIWTDDVVAIPKLCSDLRYNIWKAFKEQGIDIPFPQRDIHIRSFEERPH